MLGKFCSQVSLKRRSQQSIISTVHAFVLPKLVFRLLILCFAFRYGEQAGRVTGDAMGAVANAVEVCLIFYINFILIFNC